MQQTGRTLARRVPSSIQNAAKRSISPSPIARAAASPSVNPLTTTTNNITGLNTAARFFSTAKMSANVFVDQMRARRSFYPLSKDLPISTERVTEIVKDAIHQTPSSFNSQSNRVLVLYGAEHEKLWDLTTECLKPFVPEDAWAATGAKMAMFKAAAGTVRFLSLSPLVVISPRPFLLFYLPFFSSSGQGFG